MGRHRKVSHQQIMAVHRQGLTLLQAVDALGVSKSTLAVWAREHGQKWNSLEDMRRAAIDKALDTPLMREQWTRGVPIRKLAKDCGCGSLALTASAKRIGLPDRPKTKGAIAMAKARTRKANMAAAERSRQELNDARAAKAAAKKAAFDNTLEGRIMATGGSYAKLDALAKREGGGLTGSQLLMRWHRLRVAA